MALKLEVHDRTEGRAVRRPAQTGCPTTRRHGEAGRYRGCIFFVGRVHPYLGTFPYLGKCRGTPAMTAGVTPAIVGVGPLQL